MTQVEVIRSFDIRENDDGTYSVGEKTFKSRRDAEDFVNLVKSVNYSRPHRAKRISITRVVVLLLIVFGIFCVIAIPSYTHVPPSRHAGSYLYFMSSGWRKHVEEHARRTSSLVGSNFGLKSPVVEDAEFGRFEMSIDSNGTIKVRNTKFNLEALITPTLREGTVHWSCKGTPAKDMTPWCR